MICVRWRSAARERGRRRDPPGRAVLVGAAAGEQRQHEDVVDIGDGEEPESAAGSCPVAVEPGDGSAARR